MVKYNLFCSHNGDNTRLDNLDLRKIYMYIHCYRCIHLRPSGTHMQTHKQTHTQTHTYTPKLTHKHTHTHTHTHTRTLAQNNLCIMVCHENLQDELTSFSLFGASFWGNISMISIGLFSTATKFFSVGWYPSFRDIITGSAFFPLSHSSASSDGMSPCVIGYRSSWK